MNASPSKAFIQVSTAPGVWAGMLGLFQRDIKLVLRQRSDTFAALAFFIIVASMFPLGIGPQATLLKQIASGVLWVAALLSAMLGMARMFSEDYADGTIEQMLLSATPLPLLVLAKVCAHWLCSGFLLSLLSPLLAMQFGMSPESTWILAISLLLGTPILTLLGAIGAALTLGVRSQGTLLSLLVLPLVIPVLIFGAGAVDAANAGLGVAAHFSLLGALLLFALPLAPLATAAACRIALE
jgi:heme exporter protein B